MNLFSGFGFDLYQWIFAIVAALCLGMSKTGFTGMSMLGTALMAEVWPARESTGVILPMLKLPFSYSLGLINLNSLGFNLILLPGVALGALAGHWLLKIVPQLLFERLLLASAALAALRLIWR